MKRAAPEKMKIRALTIALVAFLVIVAPIKAQEEEPEFNIDDLNLEELLGMHPLTNIPAASDDLEVTPMFPNSIDGNYASGEIVEIIATVRNTGDKAYNLTMIIGSLNDVNDFSQYVQNYTVQPQGVVVQPGEETTVPYYFRADPSIEPKTYRSAFTIFYDDESNQPFATTFYNETTELYEPAGELDTKKFFSMMALAAGTALAGFVLYKVFKVANRKSRRPARPQVAGTKGQLDSDWLQGTAADPKKATSPKSPKRKQVQKK